MDKLPNNESVLYKTRNRMGSVLVSTTDIRGHMAISRSATCL